jgi:hypothetical protein
MMYAENSCAKGRSVGGARCFGLVSQAQPFSDFSNWSTVLEITVLVVPGAAPVHRLKLVHQFSQTSRLGIVIRCQPTNSDLDRLTF